MEHELVDGRLRLYRVAEKREPTLHRLRRIEGQVRGLQQMIEQDRYCRADLGIGELASFGALVGVFRQTGDAVALEAAVQAGACELGRLSQMPGSLQSEA